MVVTLLPAAEASSGTLTIGGDLTVGRIGFGAMRLTGDQVWGDYPDRDAGVALLRSAVELGVTFIDTADVYGPHANEFLIHDALHPYPPGLVIATKGGFVRGGFDYSTLDAVGNPNYLRQSAHMSARRLGLDQIDLYYLHSGRATDVPFETQIETLAALREEGLIRHIGLSNVTVEQVQIARTIVAIAAITAHFHAGVRTGADLLTLSEQEGMVFSPWHPLSVYEGGNKDQVREVLEPIARLHDVTESQVALAWQLQHSTVSLPIPGTTSLAHLQENLAVQDIRLDPGEVHAITNLVGASSGASGP
jgi:aryl-alcohol dehydrogenase-like predicted oxidoreductase